MAPRKRIPAAAVLVFGLLLPQAAAAGDDTIATAEVQPDYAHPTTNDPAQDVADYAKYWGVSVDEAALDLDRQRSAGLLEEQLAAAGDDWFGGLWIDHDPSFHIVVASTKPGNEDLIRIVKASEVAPFVNVTAVGRTLDELQTTAARYQSVNDASYRVGIDVTKNMVTIDSPDPKAALDLITGADLALAGNDAIRFDNSRLHLTAIQGGRHVDGSMNCTTGFGVVDIMGFKYASTAAHCPTNLTYQPGGISLSFGAEKFSGSVDMEIAFPPSSTSISYFVYDGGHNFPLDTRPMIGTRTRAAQVVGGTYCKYGRSTGYTCGELQGKWDECATPSPANTCMFLSRSGVKMADDGDSGGPVFQGYFAAGWVHACFEDAFTGQCQSNTPMLYIAEDYISQLPGAPHVLIGS